MTLFYNNRLGTRSMNGSSPHQKQFSKLQTYQMNLVSIQNNISY